MILALIFAGIAISPQPADTTPTSPATCEILQAAYKGSMRTADDIYPSNLALARQEPMQMDQLNPKYREAIGLAPAEFESIVSGQKIDANGSFIPNCAWKGRAASLGKEDGGTPTSFSHPILSSDGRLALVEISFSMGIHAFGNLCLLRRPSTTWTGSCFLAWSIR